MLVATVNIGFRDEKGKTSTTKIRIPNDLSILAYTEFAESVVMAVKAMTLAEITDFSVSVGLDLSGASLKSVATQFADVFNKAFIQARNAVNGLFGKFNIPTYDDANNLANSDQLDLADTQVAALVTLIEDGIDPGDGLIYPVTIREDALSNVVVAVEKFRAT